MDTAIELTLRIICLMIGIFGVIILTLLVKVFGWIIEDIFDRDLVDFCTDTMCFIVLALVGAVLIFIGCAGILY